MGQYITSKMEDWLQWTYRRQCQNSDKRGHRPPEYNVDELRGWVFSQKKFFILFKEWEMAKFKTSLYPSIDRKHNSIHYCFRNIQLLTWYENNQKQNFEMGKSISQLTKDGLIVSSYPSIREAARQTKSCQSAITKVCKGKMKSTNGYLWEYN